MQPDRSAQAARLGAARAVFRRWLHLPDSGALDVLLGTVAANRLDGDPVWTLLVGPPGGGKSELLSAISGLDDVHPAATLTEASLLSGTPQREKASDAKGGLLRTIGERGIIVCKDFGSVLSMNRDARSAVLAALREVYDGAWTRHVGTDGGRTLTWAGRIGLVGGVTPFIDRHHAVMGAMGERFCLYRLREVDSDVQARGALSHAGQEKTMRAELAEAARDVLQQLAEPRERTDGETDRLVALTTFVVRARSAVERDGYTREIELVPSPEAPTRLGIVLDRLLAGLDAIGCDRDQALRLVSKVALDSVPALRLAVIHALHAGGTLDTNAVAEVVRHPAGTTRRALEDLHAHGLVDLEPQGPGKAHLWGLSAFTQDRAWSFPDMSLSTRSGRVKGSEAIPTFREHTGQLAHSDIPGTVEPSRARAHALAHPAQADSSTNEETPGGPPAGGQTSAGGPGGLDRCRKWIRGLAWDEVLTAELAQEELESIARRAGLDLGAPDLAGLVDEWRQEHTRRYGEVAA